MPRRQPRPPGRSADPRQHHIVPAFYLAGFTPTLDLDGALWVFRYRTTNHFRTSPRKACRERDYYRFHTSDESADDPFFMERLMAWHEGVVAPFVRQIATDRRVSDRKQVGEALALAALLVTRGRPGRAQLTQTLSTNVLKALRSETVTRSEWERYRQDELANGASEHDCPDYDEARDRALSGGWLPRPPRALVVGLIPDLQDRLMKRLAERQWELMVTDANANGGFVTSDAPVTWGDLSLAAEGSRPSLDDPGVEITFPVSKDAVLVSYAGARASNCDATDEIVAHINARTVHMTDGVIMHAHDDFLLRSLDGEVRPGSQYFEYIRGCRRRGIFRP
jgi:hypothetical protein